MPGDVIEDAHSPRLLAALFPNMGVTSWLAMPARGHHATGVGQRRGSRFRDFPVVCQQVPLTAAEQHESAVCAGAYHQVAESRNVPDLHVCAHPAPEFKPQGTPDAPPALDELQGLAEVHGASIPERGSGNVPARLYRPQVDPRSWMGPSSLMNHGSGYWAVSQSAPLNELRRIC